MSVINANPLMLGDAGYNINRSLRFRSSASAYLNRTPASAGNQQKFTWSGWVKRGTLGAEQCLISDRIDDNNKGFFSFTSGDSLYFLTNNSGPVVCQVTTSAVFRDPSAWYHIILSVDTTQATAANRVLLYINGTQQSVTINTQVSQNTNLNFNLAQPTAIGRQQQSTPTNYFDGYLAEVNFIDGQALTPSSFGQTDAVTGVWQPKKYTGTYGTNGFYLPFSDNTSATTLAYDKSGNGNNWTANNISTTAGATYDSMTDVPTLTSSTAGNYCVLNPLLPTALTGASTLSYANLRVSGTNGVSNAYARGTMSLSGKFYAEFYFDVVNSTASIGVDSITATSGALATTSTSVCYRSGGNKRVLGTETAYGASWAANDIIGVAVDTTANTIEFFKNGTSQGVITSSAFFAQGDCVFAIAKDDIGSPLGYANFGQRPFSYTPPTGFKALNTFNLPDPTIKKPNQYMDATTYTGNGNPNNTTQAIVNSGSMQPDLVWVKSRSNAYNNSLFDSVRGIANTLASNSTSAEDTTGTTMLTALNSNGFTVGSNLNGSLGSTNVNGATYVGWQWKKGATPGFDIVTYTGTAVNGQTFSHSLGVAPSMMIVKGRSAGTAGGPWYVYHKSLGATNLLRLNATNAAAADNVFNYTAPTSTVFTLGAPAGYSNASGETYVNYLFAEIPGFSKFGSYTGNGSADGPFVYCGFRPKYVLIKRSDSTSNWSVWDTSRNPYNSAENVLAPNLSDAEQASAAPFDIVSNGFKIRNTGNSYGNTNGGTYIYAAFAENPFKYSLAR